MRFLRLAFVVLALALPITAFSSDFTVTNANSAGPGSLAQAITDANNNPGADVIVFNILGTGSHRIDLSAGALPDVTDTLFIDGYSQPGASANTLGFGDNAVILISLDGGGHSVKGLVVAASDCVVRGLSLTGFAPEYTVRGGLTGGYAIVVSQTSCTIKGNFIGLTPDDATAGTNGVGIWFAQGSANSVAGGSDPSARNLISNNSVDGIIVNDSVTIAGNYIGTDAGGVKPQGNGLGILVDGNSVSSSPITLIGGTNSGARNVISGNRIAIRLGDYSIYSYSSVPADNVQIKGNFIGVQPDGITPLPNRFGVTIESGSDNVIGGIEAGAGNVIAYNGSGIELQPTNDVGYSYGNSILSNSIYENVGEPIDLGADGSTPNDAQDADDGPNHLQNYPVFNELMRTSQAVTLRGTLNSAPNAQFLLQFFAEAPSATQPEQIYLGSTNVTTGSDGNAAFSVSYPKSQAEPSFPATYRATATNATGETSEFSPQFPSPIQLKNISTRGNVLTDNGALIGGFILSTDRTIVLRGLGPSINDNNIPQNQRLADPTLQLFDSSGNTIASNDNWQDDSAAATRLQILGLAPQNPSESALIKYLPKGAYTSVLRGKDNSTGLGLFEAYDVTTAGGGEPANISTRGVVGLGDNVLIGGFILQETGITRIVLRGIGPSLSNSGVSGALADPVLELHDAQGMLIASNDNWRDTQEDALIQTTLEPTDDRESAILSDLPNGNYTVIVSGKNGQTGIALVEVYNVL